MEEDQFKCARSATSRFSVRRVTKPTWRKAEVMRYHTAKSTASESFLFQKVQKLSFCCKNTHFSCKKCCSSVKRAEYSGGVEHECGCAFCLICRKPQKPGHDCNHTPPDAKERERCLKRQKTWRIFVIDFETIVTTEAAVSSDMIADGPEHVPNLVCGQFICNECVGKDDCIYCGPPIVFSYQNEEREGPVIEQFVKFLQTDIRLSNAIVVAHNGGK